MQNQGGKVEPDMGYSGQHRTTNDMGCDQKMESSVCVHPAHSIGIQTSWIPESLRVGHIYRKFQDVSRIVAVAIGR